MSKEIPAPVMAVLAEHLADIETHASLNNLFLHADAPGDPPEGSKLAKVQAWLKRINNESEFPHIILGNLIECYMEIPEQDEEKKSLFGHSVRSTHPNPKKEFRDKLQSILTRCNLTYMTGGFVSDGSSATS